MPESRHDAPCLSVCMRCKHPQWSGGDERRPGRVLADAVLAELRRRGVDARFREIYCMSQCKRPCVAAFSAADRFTYLFGDLDPARDAQATVDAFLLYLSREDGFMERSERPEKLRAGILGRIPPLAAGSRLVESDHAVMGPVHD